MYKEQYMETRIVTGTSVKECLEKARALTTGENGWRKAGKFKFRVDRAGARVEQKLVK
jgi:hypothetical protein